MKNTILQLTKELLTIPSMPDHGQALYDILNRAKNAVGKDYIVEEFTKNQIPSLLIHNQQKGTRYFKIILNAHLDVIPAELSQFSPIEKNGRLYARGAYDMKAAAAVMILLFKELGQKLSYPLALQLVTDEETGGANGTKHQLTHNVRGDFIIAGECTDFAINHESKGVLWINLTTTGTAAHGAYPWLGENAIVKMAQNIINLTNVFPIPPKDSWKTTLNIGQIKTTNTATNKVPDHCELAIDVRFIHEDKETVLDTIKKALLPNTTIEVVLNEPLHIAQENTPYISLLKDQLKHITKKDALFVSKHGSSDIRFYTAVGCEGITFGPVGNGHHSDNEYVDIKSLENYYLILKHFLHAVETLH